MKIALIVLKIISFKDVHLIFTPQLEQCMNEKQQKKLNGHEQINNPDSENIRKHGLKLINHVC